MADWRGHAGPGPTSYNLRLPCYHLVVHGRAPQLLDTWLQRLARAVEAQFLVSGHQQRHHYGQDLRAGTQRSRPGKMRPKHPPAAMQRQQRLPTPLGPPEHVGPCLPEPPSPTPGRSCGRMPPSAAPRTHAQAAASRKKRCMSGRAGKERQERTTCLEVRLLLRPSQLAAGVMGRVLEGHQECIDRLLKRA